LSGRQLPSPFTIVSYAGLVATAIGAFLWLNGQQPQGGDKQGAALLRSTATTPSPSSQVSIFDLGLPRLQSPGNAAQTITIEQWRGRPFLVNFWASWCANCREERPKLKELGKELPGAVVGIATADNSDAVSSSEKQDPHGYPIGIDADGRLAKALSIEGLPQSLVFDRRGRLLKRFQGALTDADIAAIKTLLAGP
jgi:cytochrome c biogenesis protein CcmG/thiol:disulfide interchange protein DsbE